MSFPPFEELRSTPRLFHILQYTDPRLGPEMDLTVRSITLSPSSLTLAGKPAYPHRGKECVSWLVLLSFELSLGLSALRHRPRAADGTVACSVQNRNRPLWGMFCKVSIILSYGLPDFVLLERGLSHTFSLSGPFIHHLKF